MVKREPVECRHELQWQIQDGRGSEDVGIGMVNELRVQ